MTQVLPKISTTVGTGTQGLQAAGLKWDDMDAKYRSTRLRDWLGNKASSYVPPPPVERVSAGILRDERDLRRKRREEMMDKHHMEMEQRSREGKRELEQQAASSRQQEERRIAGIREFQTHDKLARERALSENKLLKADRIKQSREAALEFRRIEQEERQRARDERDALKKRTQPKTDVRGHMVSSRKQVVQDARKQKKLREQMRTQMQNLIHDERCELVRKKNQTHNDRVTRHREEREMLVLAQKKQMREDFLNCSKEIFADRHHTECIMKESVHQTRVQRANRLTRPDSVSPSRVHSPGTLPPMSDLSAPSRLHTA